MTTTANKCKLKGGCHFVGHLDNRSSEKKNISDLEPEFDGSNPYMKFGRNLIKNDLVRVTTTEDGQTDRRKDIQTDGQAENKRAPIGALKIFVKCT